MLDRICLTSVTIGDALSNAFVTASPNFIKKGDAFGDFSVTHALVTHQ